MNDHRGNPKTDQHVRDIDLVLQGYTVSGQGGCVARIGANYVMRDGKGRCVRIAADTMDGSTLESIWAGFCCPMTATNIIPIGRDTMVARPVYTEDVVLVLQGYTVSTNGFCVARIGDHYVMRDSNRRCRRIPVEAVDQVLLGVAWATFCCDPGSVVAVESSPEQADVPGSNTHRAAHG